MSCVCVCVCNAKLRFFGSTISMGRRSRSRGAARIAARGDNTLVESFRERKESWRESIASAPGNGSRVVKAGSEPPLPAPLLMVGQGAPQIGLSFRDGGRQWAPQGPQLNARDLLLILIT